MLVICDDHFHPLRWWPRLRALNSKQGFDLLTALRQALKSSLEPGIGAEHDRLALRFTLGSYRRRCGRNSIPHLMSA